MIRALVVSVFMIASISTVLAAGPPPPKGPVTVNLPGEAGYALKPGPGLDAAQRYCLTCHSSAYVSTQPALTKAQWTAEVTKMVKVFGAPIPDDQVAPLVDYLTTEYGKP